MMKITLIVLMLALGTIVHAEEKVDTKVPAQNEIPDDAEHQVAIRRDFATAQGLRNQDGALFKPRNFRAEDLNTMDLEPLRETDDAAKGDGQG